MKNKTLRTKKVRNVSVSLVEQDSSSNPFWRVEVATPGSYTSVPYDDYKIALMAWKDRVESISIFG